MKHSVVRLQISTPALGTGNFGSHWGDRALSDGAAAYANAGGNVRNTANFYPDVNRIETNESGSDPRSESHVVIVIRRLTLRYYESRGWRLAALAG